jgi:type III secretion system FlhB-like substrate exporter
MTRTILLIAAGVTVGALIAKQNQPKVQPDPIDIIIEKSKHTMQQASQVSARADQQVSESISKMKETIEVLVEEKEQLVEQVKVMENEIVAIKSEPAAQPFDVLAIGLPDSTDRK